MQHIVHLLFEARKLKDIPRSGYHFLEAGKESVAEHSFITTFIALIMAQMHPEIDGDRLIQMCLIHDFHEARTGDLNYVQKKYVSADEVTALYDAVASLPFKSIFTDLMAEFNEGKTPEAKLARDADQLAFVLDLKSLIDQGHNPSKKWIDHVIRRLKTDTGKKLALTISQTESDAWWLKDYSDNFVDRPIKKN